MAKSRCYGNQLSDVGSAEKDRYEPTVVQTLPTRRNKFKANRSTYPAAVTRTVVSFDSPEVTPSAVQQTTDNGVRCVSICGSDPRLDDVSFRSDDTWRQFGETQRLIVEDAADWLLMAIGDHAHLMTSLDSLSVTWSPMKTISGSWLKSKAAFRRLRTLSLTRNQLRTIDDVKSMGCFQLESLNVSGNLIEVLPKNIGRFLPQLTVLNVSGNALRALPDGVGQLLNLRCLDCSRNRLTRLPKAVCNLINLVCLDSSGNQITSLPENIGTLGKLEDLRLSGNRITTVPDSFARLSSLHSLLIAHNRLFNIPMQFSALSQLVHLNASSNRIAAVDCALPAMRSLVLDDNQLASVPRGVCFSRHLEVLSLERNRIVDVTAEIGQLVKLRTLKLAGNECVSAVPETALEGLVGLRHIGLRSTRVRSLPESLTDLKRLTLIDIGESIVDVALTTSGVTESYCDLENE